MNVKQVMNKINHENGKVAYMADKVINKRYKTMSKTDLLNNDIVVVIDGVPTNKLSLEELSKMRNYKTFDVYQFSYKFKRWILKKITPNITRHDKGINKSCTYYQISLRIYGVPKGIPFHRFVYLWFNGEIKPYNNKHELMDICHIDRNSSNNHITNLIWDTRKNNIAQRTGATNQYGKEKK